MRKIEESVLNKIIQEELNNIHRETLSSIQSITEMEDISNDDKMTLIQASFITAGLHEKGVLNQFGVLECTCGNCGRDEAELNAEQPTAQSPIPGFEGFPDFSGFPMFSNSENEDVNPEQFLSELFQLFGNVMSRTQSKTEDKSDAPTASTTNSEQKPTTEQKATRPSAAPSGPSGRTPAKPRPVNTPTETKPDAKK